MWTEKELSHRLSIVLNAGIYLVLFVMQHICIQARLLSEDIGKHLMGVQNLLQNHELLEADINVIGTRVTSVSQQGGKFAEDDESGGLYIPMCLALA